MKKYLFGVFSILAVIAIGIIAIINLAYPLRYRTEIINVAKKYHLEAALIASIINAESGFDKDKISNKNAIGLMQVLPSTADYINSEPTNLFNAQENIEVGVKYLVYLIDKFNDTQTALFAYNAGEGNVSKWLADGGETTLKTCPFRETNAYVEKILHGVKFYRGRI